MRELKQKIEQLEFDMDINKVYSDHQLSLFKEYLKQPMFLSIAVAATAGLSFFVARTKGRRQFLRTLIVAPLFMMRMIRSVQFLASMNKLL